MTVMKRMMALLMTVFVCLALIACGDTQEQNPYKASQADIDYLNSKYEGRVAYYGDLHDHSKDADFIFKDNATKAYAPQWISAMDELDLDFQVLANHRQVYHMCVDGWDSTRLIGATEAGCDVMDSKATGSKHIDFNLIAPNVDALVKILKSEQKFYYTGGKNGIDDNKGTYQNPALSIAEIQKLIRTVQDQGGLWVHVHPKADGYMESEEALDYWFADYTGLEVFYITRDSDTSKENYELWKELLQQGKRVWATAGYDQHNLPAAQPLNVIYSEQKDAATYVSHLAQGDFVCGGVGIRMAIGDATMGGHIDFAGKRVVLSVGDFHSLIAVKDHTYRVDVISDKGVVFSQKITMDTTYFAFDADESASFYRVEVHDESRYDTLLALGNPIWND